MSSTSTTDRIERLDSNLGITLPSNWEMSFDYKGSIDSARFGLIPKSNSSNSSNYSLFVQVSSNDYVGVYRDTSTHGLDSGRLSADNTQYHNCKLTGSSNNVTWLLGGTNSASASINWVSSHNPYTLGLSVWKTGTNYVKNLKIKPL